MRKKLLLGLAVAGLALQGCAYHTITTTTKDKETGQLLACHAAGLSWFESSDKFAAGACGGTVEAAGVKGDAQMVGAVVNAAVGAAVKAVAP